MSGNYYQVMEILGRPFRVSAGAFFQVNNAVAEAMVQHILDTLPEFVPLSAQTVLLDVYCGVGLFSAFLAGRVGKLVGIEASPQACEDFVVNLDEFDNVELFEAPAETVLPVLDDEPDVILVDPPRAGLDTAVLDSIVELAPEVLVYVSCDPATLGRDAKRLTRAGYRLAQITPFDMFPQTYHIESISFWVYEG
jgi:23S rRNA (uracil1939-C5)-methyltransferase